MPAVPKRRVGRSMVKFAQRASVALLLRGEPFRLGCDAAAIAQQLSILRSYADHIIAPLRANGTRVAVLLGPSRNKAAPPCREELWPTIEAALAAEGSSSGLAAASSSSSTARTTTKATMLPVDAHNQGEAMQHVLALFWPQLLACEVSVLARFDVPLLRPLSRWTCSLSSGHLSFASQCARCCGEWSAWRCVGDLVHVIPRRLLGSFRGIIGMAGNSSSAAGSASNVSGGGAPHHTHVGCFHPGSKYRSGHDCLNVWLASGGEAVDFCAPPPTCETEDTANFRIVRSSGPLGFDRLHPEEVVLSQWSRGRGCANGG